MTTSPSEATLRTIGSGIGTTSASGPRWAEELGVDRRREQDVERAGHVGRGQARRDQARLPDRHVSAVDRDDDGIREDADEGDRHARLAPVDPGAEQEDRVRRDEQRDAKGLGERHVAGEGGLGPVADDDGEEDRRHPAQADLGEVAEPARRRRGRRSGRARSRRGAPPSASRRRRVPDAVAADPCSPMSGGSGRRRIGAPASGSPRPGSRMPSTHFVRTNASTTSGSNWMPANLRSSARACSAVSGVIRYGRLAVIASNASATWRMRASFGISSPISDPGSPSRCTTRGGGG